MYRYALMILLLAGCTQPSQDQPEIIEVEPPLQLPDDFSYKGQNPKIGTADMLDPVIEMNKRFSEKNTDLADLFADSVTVNLEDGTTIHGTREELVSGMAEYISMYDSINVTINAAIPIVYDNLDHQWVYSWIYEEYYKDGEKSTRYMHEDFRLENGKIRVMYQFKRNSSE